MEYANPAYLDMQKEVQRQPKRQPSRTSTYDDWTPISQGNYAGNEYGYSGEGYYDSRTGGVHSATNSGRYNWTPRVNYAQQEHVYNGMGFYDSSSGNVYGGYSYQMPQYVQPSYSMPSYGYSRMPSRRTTYDDWTPMHSGRYMSSRYY